MSTNIKTSSVRVEQFQLEKIKSQVSSELVEAFDLSVSSDMGISVDTTEIISIDSEGFVLEGVIRTGYRGKPITDSYSFVENTTQALKHESCVTEPTEGKPVWFDTAAWCNYCNKLYNSEDRYIGRLKCDGCNSTFPRNGIMRATLPETIQFKEHVEFDNSAESIDNIVKSIEDALEKQT